MLTHFERSSLAPSSLMPHSTLATAATRCPPVCAVAARPPVDGDRPARRRLGARRGHDDGNWAGATQP
eukprot:7437228-Pyramimonas_sp.AAC.1